MSIKIKVTIGISEALATAINNLTEAINPGLIKRQGLCTQIKPIEPITGRESARELGSGLSSAKKSEESASGSDIERGEDVSKPGIEAKSEHTSDQAPASPTRRSRRKPAMDVSKSSEDTKVRVTDGANEEDTPDQEPVHNEEDTPDQEPVHDEGVVTTGVEITKEAVREAAVQAMIRKPENKNGVTDLLAKYGVDRVKELPEAVWGEFIVSCNAL